MISYDAINNKIFIEHSWVNRSFARQLTKKLKHKMEKKNRNDRFTILMNIRVTLHNSN
jgi:hypothetical protein